jgi:hypothetical protein
MPTSKVIYQEGAKKKKKQTQCSTLHCSSIFYTIYDHTRFIWQYSKQKQKKESGNYMSSNEGHFSNEEIGIHVLKVYTRSRIKD